MTRFNSNFAVCFAVTAVGAFWAAHPVHALSAADQLTQKVGTGNDSTAALSGARLAQPVAQILAVRPVVELHENRANAKGIPASSLVQLRPGDSLTTLPIKGDVTVVFYGDGACFRLLSGSTAIVGSHGLQHVSGRAPVSLAPIDQRVVHPIFNAVTSDRRIGPNFGGQVDRALNGIWRGPTGAQRSAEGLVIKMIHRPDKKAVPSQDEATVSVLRLRDNAVVWQGPVPDLAATTDLITVSLPADPFTPGESYAWRIGRESSTFRILSQEKRASLESAEGVIATLPRAGSRDATRELLVSELDEIYGLIGDASVAYASVLKIDPDNKTARDWLAHYDPENTDATVTRRGV